MMKMPLLNRWNVWRKLILLCILFPLLFTGILSFIVYQKQDGLVQGEIDALNQLHKGLIEIGDTHIAPFKNFPYISIKVDSVQVYESKEQHASLILEVADIYVGFNVWDIINGNYDVQQVLVEDGFFNIIQHTDGSMNIENALATPSEEATEEEPLDIHLKRIELRDLDIHTFDEENNLDIETYIYWANSGFKTANNEIDAHIDTEFELNIIQDKDTSFIKHKHFEFHTDILFDELSGLLNIAPSGIKMENGDFRVHGSIETKKEMDLDLHVNGTKPNFDMLIAFAPEDLIPTLERYNNAGEFYFQADIVGPTSDEQMPFIDLTFGADEAFLENVEVDKKVDDLGFKGHFTNGKQKSLETMEFSIEDFSSKLEQGNFSASIFVKNFIEPEVELALNTDFDLEFLTQFFNLSSYVENVTGKVKLDMRFHDIIDLEHPEKALNQLNQAYFSELNIENLHVESPDLIAPIDQLDLHLAMNGKRGVLDTFELKMGATDLSLTGYVSDLPAIVHHTDTPVEAELNIRSNLFDIAELTGFSKGDSSGIDEQIEDLRLLLKATSSARAITESAYLPEGEFFIEELHAQLKHYPHELHDFHVDILIDSQDLKIVDFTGFIDKSDFHFNGNVHDYGFWMKDTLEGDVTVDMSLHADMLKLEDLFSYQGENYVPEDYRHEEFDNLKLHLTSDMHYKDSELHSIDIDLDQFDAKMHVHPMRLEDFSGRVHYEDEHLVIENMHGKIGRTVFDMDMNYYLGEDESIKLRDNHFGLTAGYIDFDQLFAFNTAPPQDSTNSKTPTATTEDVELHSTAFNIYELPFTDMTFDVDVDHFIYHHIDLQDIHSRLRITHDHYIYVDTMSMMVAGGQFFVSGYFNGSNPDRIYLKPKIKLTQADVDQLLFKYESFGSDEVLSDYVHGQLSADITGNIRVYPDMIPDLDQSEIHMDVELLNGRLENYEPVLMLSDYMGDKNLSSVRFDTLQNHMDITNGVITIPNMTIESTLGHYELSGEQSMIGTLDYYIRIPWTIIRQGARQKLFGNKKTKDGEVGDDEIIENDLNKKTRYLNLRVKGTLDDYDIQVNKKRKDK